jgi:hypothetical protein
MNIKDYLHLYLGCRVRIVEDEVATGILIGLVERDGYNTEHPCRVKIERKGKHSLYYCFDYSEIKPILRPLSDMTEEELQECGNMVYDFSGEPELNNHKWKDFEIAAPEQFHWLLARHFDLFGLIEAGLAIDKTTLTEPKV